HLRSVERSVELVMKEANSDRRWESKVVLIKPFQIQIGIDSRQFATDHKDRTSQGLHRIYSRTVEQAFAARRRNAIRTMPGGIFVVRWFADASGGLEVCFRGQASTCFLHKAEQGGSG